MVATVRTKPRKKQQAFPASNVAADRRFMQATLALEEAVLDVLGSDKGHQFHDVDFLYWSRRLKNVATPISLALNEYRGLKRFHYHFRHDPKDYDTLYPVAGPSPMDTLCRVCREALTDCVEMVGVQDALVRRNRDRLEAALRGFLKQKC